MSTISPGPEGSETCAAPSCEKARRAPSAAPMTTKVTAAYIKATHPGPPGEQASHWVIWTWIHGARGALSGSPWGAAAFPYVSCIEHTSRDAASRRQECV
ncbi:hypothetical protein M406DRAFT_100754 [Cryphonectria parasitica EP155]|uniref:Uncharacterized protein n=1 Tax=Cryphonectria parasitica (strain ATCC 38755 / EP155) TaxID=660469 RepID=A0A9P4YAY8_CRYP1|nr:uncharacterized protein M406DRAFT_100754 [Cryphonectria parasitica EP155]KAF3770182.1 hypothetical protein M406DRAFT_100754 [Cryphonectria parasitica EP155]